MSHITLTKVSSITGKINEMRIPLTEDEFDAAFKSWKFEGVVIQDAFPTLNDEQREFIKSGITPEEWAEIFGKDA